MSTRCTGLSTHGVPLPLNGTDSFDSGQVCVTIDPDAEMSGNAGVIDFDAGTLTVRYNAQIIFPGLYQLITDGHHDPSLLNPVRVTATDQCTVLPDLTGWRALGCLEFLPGSLWAGAEGG